MSCLLVAVSFEEACPMKTYAARPASTVTSYSSHLSGRSWHRHTEGYSDGQPTPPTSGRFTHGCHTCALSLEHRRRRVGFHGGPPPLDEARGVDKGEIATILRRALMDLMVTFQTIERQIHAAPDRRATSNRS